MTEPQETFVNTTAALDAARRLTTIGVGFSRRWEELKAAIDALHGDAPWGTDQVGQQFLENYTPHDQANGAGGVVAGLGSLAEVLAQLGPQLINAVNATVETDDETRRLMGPV